MERYSGIIVLLFNLITRNAVDATQGQNDDLYIAERNLDPFVTSSISLSSKICCFGQSLNVRDGISSSLSSQDSSKLFAFNKAISFHFLERTYTHPCISAISLIFTGHISRIDIK
jgi:hypothetical protein